MPEIEDGSLDGTLPSSSSQDEEQKMADLPEGVLTELIRAGASAHQFLMVESQGNIQHANNLLRQVANAHVNEVGSIEAQANRAVTNTPIGSPTTSAAG